MRLTATTRLPDGDERPTGAKLELLEILPRLPVREFNFGQYGATRLATMGVDQDGWMERRAEVALPAGDRPLRARLTVEFPGWAGHAEGKLSVSGDGGAAITDYRVEYRKSTETAWKVFADGTSALTSATVTGLATATNYLFRVSAINIVGTGAASAASNMVTFVAAPSEPRGLTGTAGDKTVALKWSAPATANGSPVTDYVVEYRSVADASWTVFADGTSMLTSATVTGLVNGTAYLFRVRAVNAIGTSAPSAESAALTPLGPSAAPTAVSGTGSRGTVTLTWTAPSDTGGLPITGYVVQYRLNNATAAWVTVRWPAGVPATATTVAIPGFRTRQGHVFRVAAKTSLGQGAWSDVSAPVNPFAA